MWPWFLTRSGLGDLLFLSSGSFSLSPTQAESSSSNRNCRRAAREAGIAARGKTSPLLSLPSPSVTQHSAVSSYLLGSSPPLSVSSAGTPNQVQAAYGNGSAHSSGNSTPNSQAEGRLSQREEGREMRRGRVPSRREGGRGGAFRPRQRGFHSRSSLTMPAALLPLASWRSWRPSRRNVWWMWMAECDQMRERLSTRITADSAQAARATGIARLVCRNRGRR